MNAPASFWASISATCAQLEHERSLRGKTRAKCTACGGSGHSEPGRSDSDAHGSYWVSAVPCRSCSGHGAVEVPCGADVEAAAIKREIGKLRAKLAELKGKKL